MLLIKHFYYYATCCCAFLIDIQRDPCAECPLVPLEVPQEGWFMRSWSRLFQSEDNWGLLILWTVAQPRGTAGRVQSAGSSLLLRVRVTGARVRDHGTVQGLDSWIQARGMLVQPSHL